MTVRVQVRDVAVTVHAADVAHLVKTAPGIRHDLARRGDRVKRVARSLVGVDTGMLLSTIRTNSGTLATGPYVDVIGGKTGRTPYMGWHHDGTEPHIITPRTARVLRFPSRGRVVFTTRVHHPGTRATKFLTRALRAA